MVSRLVCQGNVCCYHLWPPSKMKFLVGWPALLTHQQCLVHRTVLLLVRRVVCFKAACQQLKATKLSRVSWHSFAPCTPIFLHAWCTKKVRVVCWCLMTPGRCHPYVFTGGCSPISNHIGHVTLLVIFSVPYATG